MLEKKERKYFLDIDKDLISRNKILREDGQGEIDPTQQQIADTGVEQGQAAIEQADNTMPTVENQGQEMDQNMMQQQDQQMDMSGGPDDAGYIDDPNAQGGIPDNSGLEIGGEVSENFKLFKLFNLFKKLKNYVNNFINTVKTIDVSLFPDENIYNEFIEYFEKMKNIKTKISDYMLYRYSNEKYEKVLYSYIMLRTETLSVVSRLREILLKEEK